MKHICIDKKEYEWQELVEAPRKCPRCGKRLDYPEARKDTPKTDNGHLTNDKNTGG